jgi:hypothetical protein
MSATLAAKIRAVARRGRRGRAAGRRRASAPGWSMRYSACRCRGLRDNGCPRAAPRNAASRPHPRMGNSAAVNSEGAVKFFDSRDRSFRVEWPLAAWFGLVGQGMASFAEVRRGMGEAGVIQPLMIPGAS